MAKMIEGQWASEWKPTDEDSDQFIRKESVFRDELPQGPLDRGRYHLYVAWTCPWAHRTLLARSLKGLDDVIDVHFANELSDKSWKFVDDDDPVLDADYLYELYLRADPHYTGRVTVPTLWDDQEKTIVNNESSEIIRMFDRVPSDRPRLAPAELLDEIDTVNEQMYEALNNGVYRAGFAASQQAYEEAVDDVFSALDGLEQRLDGQAWLVGDRLTEADLRLFVTLFRFDQAYYPVFKCNRRKIADYPNLFAHTQRMLMTDGVLETCNLPAAKRGYASIPTINPNGIVPVGPPNELHGFERWIS